MDPMITGLGVVALMGAAATIAGAAVSTTDGTPTQVLQQSYFW